MSVVEEYRERWTGAEHLRAVESDIDWGEALAVGMVLFGAVGPAIVWAVVRFAQPIASLVPLLEKLEPGVVVRVVIASALAGAWAWRRVDGGRPSMLHGLHAGAAAGFFVHGVVPLVFMFSSGKPRCRCHGALAALILSSLSNAASTLLLLGWLTVPLGAVGRDRGDRVEIAARVRLP